jgi:hypothetical protein
MNLKYYNRYSLFSNNGEQKVVPFLKLPPKSGDNVFFYKKNVSRLDKISQQYYQSPFFGWLILAANPEHGGLENNIYDGAMLKIPFPLETSLLDYKNAAENYFFYYGK